MDGDGLIAHDLKRPLRDGTTQCLFQPLDFLARLAALVPCSRTHFIRHHGVLSSECPSPCTAAGETAHSKNRPIPAPLPSNFAA
jgi:hypothetical protein